MARNKLLQIGLGALLAVACGTAHATPSEGEAALTAFLDKEYKASLFQIGSHGRRADGNYTWSATFHRELRKPANKLREFCLSMSGNWRLLITAGSIRNHPGQAQLTLGGENFRVEHGNLWEWIGYSGRTGLHRGFDDVFDTRLFVGRDRVVADADADPPLGLFGCLDAQGNVKWAVSIMPGEYGGNSWLYLHMLPVTLDFLDGKRREAAQREAQNAASKRESERRNAAEIRALAAENARLAPWRARLKTGDQTNCGMVIDVRGPLVEIQTPQVFADPKRVQRHWMKRDDLSDAPAPRGCPLRM